jgi:hypothetical protein
MERDRDATQAGRHTRHAARLEISATGLVEAEAMAEIMAAVGPDEWPAG